jgi:hypothetical protein
MTLQATLQCAAARTLSLVRRPAALVGVLLTGAAAAMALDEQPGEEAAIKECDKRLCSILLQKNPKGPDLKCSLTKTWARSKIKEADNQKVSWGFGDARCSVEINLDRGRLVAAMTDDDVTFYPGRHTAHCFVEQDGKPEKVTAVVSPKIVFKNGKADKIWIRLKSVDGPASITLTVQTAAQFADNFGLFHRQMIRGVNRYIERHCPKALDVAGTPPAAKDKSGK